MFKETDKPNDINQIESDNAAIKNDFELNIFDNKEIKQFKN